MSKWTRFQLRGIAARTSTRLGASSIHGRDRRTALQCDRHDRWDERMPRKGITGHDGWVVTEALATALIALEQLPAKHQPRAHMEDLRKLLASGREPATVNLHLAQAKCRLFPDRDPLSIYEEYGI